MDIGYKTDEGFAADIAAELHDAVALRPRRVARWFHLSPSTVYDLLNKGEWPSIRVGKSIRIPAGFVRQLLEQAGQG
jgi:excisionase family DNA binding protein